MEAMDRQLTSCYKDCAKLTRREAKNFYFAFITLPKRKRYAIYAVYAFCREADDIADGSAPLPRKRTALKQLRHRLGEAASGNPQTRLDAALSDAMDHYQIAPSDLAKVIDGVEMDLTITYYQTFDDLKRYCHCVAAAVGLSVLPVLSYHHGISTSSGARKEAIALGLGMQLANIIRDVDEDIRRGRCYIPIEDLNRFGVSKEDLEQGKLGKCTQELLSFEIARARSYMRAGEKLLKYLPRRSRGCPALLIGIYSRILDRIEQRSYDVFSGRISLTTREKLFLALRTLIQGHS